MRNTVTNMKSFLVRFYFGDDSSTIVGLIVRAVYEEDAIVVVTSMFDGDITIVEVKEE